MKKYKHKPAATELDRHPGSVTGGALSEEGTARRSFLGTIGKWSAALAVSGLGLETAFQVFSKRSMISSALAVGSPGSLPPIPADQNPPPAPVPTGTIYWMATNGNDNDGGTEDSPFLTLSRAVTACGPNDGVFIKAGTYVMGALHIKKGNLIIRGAPGTTREQVILTRPSGSGGQQHLLRVGTNVHGGEAPQENVQFYGLTLQGGPEIPNPEYQWQHSGRIEHWANEVFRCNGYFRNSKIINCVLRHARNRGWVNGMTVAERFNNMVHNLEFSHCHFYYHGVDLAGAGINYNLGGGFFHIHHCEFDPDRDAIVSTRGFIGSLIEFNHMNGNFTRQAGLGAGFEDAVDLKLVEEQNPLLPASARTIIRNNIMRDFRQSAVTVQMFSLKTDIYNNLIYDCRNTGIWLANNAGNQDQSTTKKTRDIKIWNNDIRNNGAAIISVTAGNDVVGAQAGAYEVLIDNNRIFDNGGAEWADRIGQLHGIRMNAGGGFAITNNVLSKNAAGDHGAQITIGNVGWLDDADDNTFYLPTNQYFVGRVGGRSYTLAEWRTLTGKDINSVQSSGPYEPAAPPEAPLGIDVVQSRGDLDTA